MPPRLPSILFTSSSHYARTVSPLAFDLLFPGVGYRMGSSCASVRVEEEVFEYGVEFGTGRGRYTSQWDKMERKEAPDPCAKGLEHETTKSKGKGPRKADVIRSLPSPPGPSRPRQLYPPHLPSSSSLKPPTPDRRIATPPSAHIPESHPFPLALPAKPPPPSHLLNTLLNTPSSIQSSHHTLRAYAKRMWDMKAQRKLDDWLRRERVSSPGLTDGMKEGRGGGRNWKFRRRTLDSGHDAEVRVTEVEGSSSASLKLRGSGRTNQSEERKNTLESLWRLPSTPSSQQTEEPTKDTSTLVDSLRKRYINFNHPDIPLEILRRANKRLLNIHPPLSVLPARPSKGQKLGYIHHILLSYQIKDHRVVIEAALDFLHSPSPPRRPNTDKKVTYHPDNNSAERKKEALEVLHLFLGYLPRSAIIKGRELVHKIVDEYGVGPTRQTLHLVILSLLPRRSRYLTFRLGSPTTEDNPIPPTSIDSISKDELHSSLIYQTTNPLSFRPDSTQKRTHLDTHAQTLLDTIETFKISYGVTPGRETYRKLIEYALLTSNHTLARISFTGWSSCSPRLSSLSTPTHAFEPVSKPLEVVGRRMRSWSVLESGADGVGDEEVSFRFDHSGVEVVRYLKVLKAMKDRGWVKRIRRMDGSRTYVWVGGVDETGTGGGTVKE